MDLYDQICALTDNAINDAAAYKNGDVGACLRAAELCESQLSEWYAAKANPDYRLIKLLKNLIFYLNTPDSQLSYQTEILAAIAKTLQRAADYDLNIREYPDKVRERNDGIIRLCDELRNEKKLPLEENSDKPFDITIYMATYNQLELTKLCLDSIFRNTNDISYELYLIDNGSIDGSYEYFKNDDRIKLIRLEENTGLLLALHIFYESGLDNGKFWMYMNNDVVVTPRWASNMLRCIKSDPRIASVLPTTNRAAPFVCVQPPFGLYDVEDVQNFGQSYNISNPNMWLDWLIYYGFVLLARPSVRRKIGYHEDCFYFSFYYSDGDIILSQLKAGYRAVQARDTYIHHFDGGHTVLQNRRAMLAAGEKQFFNKYGFFPSDLERNLPIGVTAGAVGAVGGTVAVAGARILFLGSGRSHPLMQLQWLNMVMNTQNTKYYAADTMEQLKLEQYGKDVKFQQMDNWYEMETIFEGEVFDVVIYTDDTMKLRNPARFLSAIYSRLSINGKLYFLSENSGCLLALNYILMSQRNSPRDSVRVRKNSAASLNELIDLLTVTGFSIDSIEDIFYNETFTYANLSTIDNYRELYRGDDMTNFERNIRIPVRNIVARKPGNVNISNTLEQLLYAKKDN